MKEMKIGCSKCGGHIIIPIELSGQQIICPHCTEQFLAPKSRQGIAWAIAIAIASITVGYGMLSLWEHKPQHAPPQTVGTITPVKTIADLGGISATTSGKAPALVKTIADFGGKADGTTDDTPAFIRAFEFAALHSGITLRLGGVCRFLTAQVNTPFGSTAVEGHSITNMTIEDGEVLLGGPFGAFNFWNCPGLTLRDLVFDYDSPQFSQGKIISSVRKEKTITVVPDAGYPPPVGDAFTNRNATWLTVHNPDGANAFNFVGYIDAAVPERDGSVVLTHDNPNLAAVIEGKSDLRYVRVQRDYAPLNTFDSCDGLTLQRCNIYAARGFASLFSFCNDVSILDCRICPREGTGRIVSTCADGFHFIAARRGPRIEGNSFDHLQDDNVVISLRGSWIQSYNGTELDLSDTYGTRYEAGDIVEVVSPQEANRREYRIMRMEPYHSVWRPGRITLDRPLEGQIVTMAQTDAKQYPTLVFNKSWCMNGTLICSNRFQNTRRYAVFMGASGVRIEDNVMSNHTSAAILCSYIDPLADAHASTRYYFSSDITIARNTIINAQNYGEAGVNLGNWHGGAIDFYDKPRDKIGIGALELMHDVSIIDNRIVNSGSAGIHIANARNITVSGNSIVEPNRLRRTNRYGIWAEATANLNITNNTVSGASLDNAVKIDP